MTMTTIDHTRVRRLHDGINLLSVYAVSCLPPVESARLAESPFSIEFDFGARPAEAMFVIGGELAPILTVSARDWPPTLGDGLAWLLRSATDRLRPEERRLVARALRRGGRPTVAIESDTWVYTLGVQVGDRRAVFGRLGLTPAVTH